MTATSGSDIVIIDETEPCPYLQGETARMPLRMPLGKITLEQADMRLSEGNRRTGEFIYQTRCPTCRACEPIRLDCYEFAFSRNNKRLVNRSDQRFRQTIGPLVSDLKRVDLFNKHRRRRGLAKRDNDIDLEEYTWGFVRSCFDSFEIAYWLGDRLVCLGVCDRGLRSLSAVYTFFDPDLTGESLGTYSILKQVEFCRTADIRFLYLGYYVAQSPHMNYKSRFRPHERLISGQWVKFT